MSPHVGKTRRAREAATREQRRERGKISLIRSIEMLP
jgi:hypothetical protein